MKNDMTSAAWALHDMAAYILKGADAIERCKALEEEVAYWKNQAQLQLQSELEHNETMMGLLLTAAVNGNLVCTPEKGA